jgi:hypothetical protein
VGRDTLAYTCSMDVLCGEHEAKFRARVGHELTTVFMLRLCQKGPVLIECPYCV